MWTEVIDALVALVPLASFCASWLEKTHEGFQHPGCIGTIRWKKTEFPSCYLLDSHLKTWQVRNTSSRFCANKEFSSQQGTVDSS